jgi:hypothetical protein
MSKANQHIMCDKTELMERWIIEQGIEFCEEKPFSILQLKAVNRFDQKELFEKLAVNLSRLISFCIPVVGFKVTSYRTPFPINRETSL